LHTGEQADVIPDVEVTALRGEHVGALLAPLLDGQFGHFWVFGAKSRDKPLWEGPELLEIQRGEVLVIFIRWILC
jgi:hypothetical protein